MTLDALKSRWHAFKTAKHCRFSSRLIPSASAAWAYCGARIAGRATTERRSA